MSLIFTWQLKLWRVMLSAKDIREMFRLYSLDRSNIGACKLTRRWMAPRHKREHVQSRAQHMRTMHMDKAISMFYTFCLMVLCLSLTVCKIENFPNSTRPGFIPYASNGKFRTFQTTTEAKVHSVPTTRIDTGVCPISFLHGGNILKGQTI